MKKPLLKLTTLLCLSFCIVSFAQQDFQGKAYYMSKTTMDLDQWGGREISPEQRKRIEERMKTMLEKEFVLTFNKEESVYKEEERLEAPGQGRGWGSFSSSFTGGPKYKNVKSKQLLQDREFFGKQFLIKDELKGLEWKMGTETKKIGNYMCFKATATKTVDEFDWRSMRPKRGGDRATNKKEKKEGDVADNSEKKDDNDPLSDIETPKTVEVVAWYTLQIPISQGPDDYWGLPGLILEVSADRTTILCTKIVMNPEEKEEIEKPEKGDEVTQAEYNEIITKKMQEMREMYGGRGGRGGRGRN
ncbi:MAG: GLPGLI family protein [Winogradskyella sp.]|uniref:GLPGLI family protein n=1 Tax=Winogradskyella sp. TaxID=1883156 RepID=UPI0025E3DA9C|nr:GLPGLI family protein [Winogradskyella sp.]NRB83829.1 GLPGLI family protein [Winogradskyella sp.]